MPSAWPRTSRMRSDRDLRQGRADERGRRPRLHRRAEGDGPLPGGRLLMAQDLPTLHALSPFPPAGTSVPAEPCLRHGVRGGEHTPALESLAPLTLAPPHKGEGDTGRVCRPHHVPLLRRRLRRARHARRHGRRRRPRRSAAPRQLRPPVLQGLGARRDAGARNPPAASGRRRRAQRAGTTRSITLRAASPPSAPRTAPRRSPSTSRASS